MSEVGMSIRNKHLIDAFNYYISKQGGEFHEWYISNTNIGTGRLVKEHGVEIDGDGWLILDATSSNRAKEIVDFFVQSCGMIGNTRDVEDAKLVYIYKCEPHTSP